MLRVAGRVPLAAGEGSGDEANVGAGQPDIDEQLIRQILERTARPGCNRGAL
jgi:hypothetical protein